MLHTYTSKAHIAAFVEGYNAHATGNGVCQKSLKIRRNTRKDEGFNASRRRNLRSQLEHNKLSNHTAITAVDFHAICAVDNHNNLWFKKQAYSK